MKCIIVKYIISHKEYVEKENFKYKYKVRKVYARVKRVSRELSQRLTCT